MTIALAIVGGFLFLTAVIGLWIWTVADFVETFKK